MQVNNKGVTYYEGYFVKGCKGTWKKGTNG